MDDAVRTDDGIGTDKDRKAIQQLMAEQEPLLGDNETNIEPKEDDLGSSEESPLIKKLRKITEMNQEAGQDQKQTSDNSELQVPIYL